ncbi:MAG: metal-sensitive transcriptional regulator [Muribaculaceae bacterium]|nr:metal-sensitive transcriptional regulator [Muribaculaceae bacterium]
MGHFSQEDKKRLCARLNRIGGQVQGINRMIEQDRECIEILNQIVSTQSALKGVWKQVVQGHLQHCVSEAMENHKTGNELIEELVEHIEKLK